MGLTNYDACAFVPGDAGYPHCDTVRSTLFVFAINRCFSARDGSLGMNTELKDERWKGFGSI